MRWVEGEYAGLESADFGVFFQKVVGRTVKVLAKHKYQRKQNARKGGGGAASKQAPSSLSPGVLALVLVLRRLGSLGLRKPADRSESCEPHSEGAVDCVGVDTSSLYILLSSSVRPEFVKMNE